MWVIWLDQQWVTALIKKDHCVRLFLKTAHNNLGKFIAAFCSDVFSNFSILTVEPLSLKQRFVGNKAKGLISKRVFQENKARQVFWKTSISYLLICARTFWYWFFISNWLAWKLWIMNKLSVLIFRKNKLIYATVLVPTLIFFLIFVSIFWVKTLILICVGFLGLRFEMGGGGKTTPYLKLVRIMLET